jgi:hypothetical protein
MTRQLVFWTAFNSYRSEKCLRNLPAGSPHPVTTRAWTRTRAKLWGRFTLPSILVQTRRDWLYVVLLDPELRALTDEMLPKPCDPRVIYCYEDGPALAKLLEYDEIVFALIDNDDMYARGAGALMMDCPAEWMYFKRGFALDAASRLAWRYDTIGSGPFFAHRLDPRGLASFDRDKRHPTHKAVIEQRPRELQPGNFCVLLHNTNTSSHPGMRYVLRDEPVSLAAIRRDFGGLA